jgi:hypothetical protein
MQEDKSIMKFEATLPENFDGVFRFTNPTDADFTGKWGGKEYTYPAMSTSPMIIPEHSPIEIQHIRKKFAKDLAEQEFYKSQGYKILQGQEGTPGNRTMSGIHQAGTYSIDQLTPFIQKCLTPLPVSQAIVKNAPKVRLEERISMNEDGEPNTSAVKSDRDLENLAKGRATLEGKVFNN